MKYSVLSKYRSELMGCAMLWAMLFHASDLDLKLAPLNLFRAMGFGGVDVFVLLSAMGLAMSLSRREQEYGAFMVRRAKRILPAYYLVMVPYTVWLITRGIAGPSALLWNASLLYYWVGSAGAFNWYVTGIMTLYAVTPALFRFLSRRKHKAAWTALGILLGLAACRVLILDEYWHHLDVFYRLPVFLLGLLIGLWVVEDRAVTLPHGLFWALCAALGLGYGYAVLASGGYIGSFHLPTAHVFLFTTLPMCLLGCVLFEKLPLGGLRQLLRPVGESSLEIYLLNVSLFSQQEQLRQLLSFCPGPGTFYLLCFALNLALGMLLHRGIAAASGVWRRRTGQEAL